MQPDIDPVYRADCPSRAILDQIADKWSMLVLMVLREPRRFNAIKRRLDGITQRVLTQKMCIRDRYPGSIITGGFNGGGGTNSLTLTGEAGSSDTLPGTIRNFQSLIKTGDGKWTLSGSVGSNGGGTPLAVQVQDGTLALTGDNTGFNGSVRVDAAGTLEAVSYTHLDVYKRQSLSCAAAVSMRAMVPYMSRATA